MVMTWGTLQAAQRAYMEIGATLGICCAEAWKRQDSIWTYGGHPENRICRGGGGEANGIHRNLCEGKLQAAAGTKSPRSL